MPKRAKRPNTTLKRVAVASLPEVIYRFLYGSSDEFRFSRTFLGTSFGSILGLGFYFMLVHPMPLQEEQKVNIMYSISGTFALGWATSSYFRCTTILILPNILGKESRLFMVVLVLAAIYGGPVANMQKNAEEIARSMSCTADQQIEYSKIVWNETTTPIYTILKILKGSSKDFNNSTSAVLKEYKEIEDEVESKDGYNQEKEKVANTAKKNSTQAKFELKTLLRCEEVVEQGIIKCKDWFAAKHETCMRTIWVPILNSLLCLPMKLTFFCNIIKLTGIWCKDRLPVEGNFGATFDTVNDTVYNLGKPISSAIVAKKDEHNVFGVNISKRTMTEEVSEILKRKQMWLQEKMAYFSTIMSCTFVFLLISSFNYTRKYNNNILHDNYYITTYFRQIDARRRKWKKDYLLPMPNILKAEVVFPFDFCVQKRESKTMVKEILRSLPFIILFLLTLAFDRLIIHIFLTIQRHFHIKYVFTVQHKVEVIIGGQGFLAKILQRAVRAFNHTASNTRHGNNTMCLPYPSFMDFSGYVFTCLPAFGLLILCLVQVYSDRLRRVIASYYFPKREKTRVLHLYNHYLRKRQFYFHKMRSAVMRKSKSKQIWQKTFLGRFQKCCRWVRHILPQRCIVCGKRKNRDSYECRKAGCCTVYCRTCWCCMGEFCWACVPYERYTMDVAFKDFYDF